MITAYAHLFSVMIDFFPGFFAVMMLTVFLTPGIIVIARKYNVLDFPDSRKIHNKPVPRLGGAAILISIWVVSLFYMPWNRQLTAVMIGSTLIALMGIVDDVRGLSSTIRIVGQVVACLIVMSSGLIVSFMPKIWWGQIFAGLITIIWIVGIVNALNFVDGLDGLAAGVAAISSLFFFLLSVYLMQKDVAFMAVLLMGSCLGFLFWNFKPAKIYLGDGGSTLLGFLLACIALQGEWSKDGVVVALGIPTIILGLLIFDMIYITVARVVGGQVRTVQQWLDYTGKDHFHHRLLSMGFTEQRAVFFIYIVCFLLGLSVLVLEKLRNPLGVFVVLLQAFLLFVIILFLMRTGHEFRCKREVL